MSWKNIVFWREKNELKSELYLSIKSVGKLNRILYTPARPRPLLEFPVSDLKNNLCEESHICSAPNVIRRVLKGSDKV